MVSPPRGGCMLGLGKGAGKSRLLEERLASGWGCTWTPIDSWPPWSPLPWLGCRAGMCLFLLTWALGFPPASWHAGGAEPRG